MLQVLLPHSNSIAGFFKNDPFLPLSRPTRLHVIHFFARPTTRPYSPWSGGVFCVRESIRVNCPIERDPPIFTLPVTCSNESTARATWKRSGSKKSRPPSIHQSIKDSSTTRFWPAVPSLSCALHTLIDGRWRSPSGPGEHSDAVTGSKFLNRAFGSRLGVL